MTDDVRRYWRKTELKPALQDLASRIDQEVQEKGISLRSLADAAGISERTLTRWFVDGRVPTDEAGVERMVHVAVTAGVGRPEAERFIPEPSMLTPAQATGNPPTQKAANQLILAQISRNTELMARSTELQAMILAEVERLGVQVERLVAQFSQQRQPRIEE